LFLELDPAAGQWIASNADRRWALLLEYWNHLAQRLDRLPRRAEIDPVDLPVGLLPNIFLVDVVRADGACRVSASACWAPPSPRANACGPGNISTSI
jgi:hypothetical protein